MKYLKSTQPDWYCLHVHLPVCGFVITCFFICSGFFFVFLNLFRCLQRDFVKANPKTNHDSSAAVQNTVTKLYRDKTKGQFGRWK